ncbi:hypothetical protein GCM10027570_40270 [Streptomonospora sediminis]
MRRVPQGRGPRRRVCAERVPGARAAAGPLFTVNGRVFSGFPLRPGLSSIHVHRHVRVAMHFPEQFRRFRGAVGRTGNAAPETVHQSARDIHIAAGYPLINALVRSL